MITPTAGLCMHVIVLQLGGLHNLQNVRCMCIQKCTAQGVHHVSRQLETRQQHRNTFIFCVLKSKACIYVGKVGLVGFSASCVLLDQTLKGVEVIICCGSLLGPHWLLLVTWPR
jgi:hypothetical protein